mgnify:CR=1 FL=1
MSESCKMEVLGKDPNNAKKPARFSDDPRVKKQQQMDLAACRRGKREDFKKRIINKGEELIKKVKKK